MSAEDIVVLLRKWAECLDIPSGPFVNEDLAFAATEIDRLRAALRQARADALEEAAKVLDANDEGMANNGRDFAQPFVNGYRTACYSIAAAIRSLRDTQARYVCDRHAMTAELAQASEQLTFLIEENKRLRSVLHAAFEEAARVVEQAERSFYIDDEIGRITMDSVDVATATAAIRGLKDKFL